MKLIRLSIVLSFFKKVKNIKKFLIIINVGIFLSIFASTASLITFFIEKKINDIEFEILNTQLEIKTTSDTISEISNIKAMVIQLINSERDISTLYEYISTQPIPDALISINDIYLPNLVVEGSNEDFQEIIKLFDNKEFGLDVQRDLLLNFYGEDSYQVEEFDKIAQEFLKLKTFDIKKYQNYYSKVFDFKPIDLSGEINDYTTIKDFNNPIYLDYLKMFDIYESFIDYANLLEEMMFDFKLGYEGILEELNNDLIRYSNNERNIIIFAFIFQIIIFLIIQIFEITSLQREMKNKKI
tara:strand:+ start:722 stop:1615 length:894 start_codon:yes stop_codon:yes gene_type:complete